MKSAASVTPEEREKVSSSVAEEVLPVSFASASFAGKEAELNDAGAATQPGFFDRYFGGGHGAPVAKAKKGDTPSVAPAKKKGRKERNAEDVQHLVSSRSGSPPVPQVLGGSYHERPKAESSESR